jgi:hypothetical protein
MNLDDQCCRPDGRRLTADYAVFHSLLLSTIVDLDGCVYRYLGALGRGQLGHDRHETAVPEQ